MRLSSHSGGGGWPGGAGGIPPGLLGAASLFGNGEYSGNIVQGGSLLQPQASYVTDMLPTATGPTTGAFTFSASSSFDSASMPWMAFNDVWGSVAGATCKCWQGTGGSAASWLSVDTGSVNPCTGYTIRATDDYPTRAPYDFTLNGSNTGVFSGEQVALDTRTGVTFTSGEKKTFTLPATANYRYYRLNMARSNDASWTALAEVELLTPPILNAVVVTGAATVDPDAGTGASVVMCDSLVLNGTSASLAPSTNSKGLAVFAKTGIILLNGAHLHIDKLGKAGNFGNLSVLDLVPASLKRKLKNSLAAYVVLGEGASGGVQGAAAGYRSGVGGASATAMQSGGGGSGGSITNASAIQAGSGGKGGPCCGGSGGGGLSANSQVQTVAALSGGDYGGPGGYGYGDTGSSWGGAPGAGDPVGTSNANGVAPAGAGGGLLVLVTPSLSIASGCIISADGSPAGSCSGCTYWSGGGSSGGGIVCIITSSGGCRNSGTVRANGGATVTATLGANGSAGGAGSVNIYAA